MRSRIWLLLALCLVAANAAAAAPTPAPTAAATEVTTTYGAIPPSLAGTWFVVLNTKAGGRYVNGWEVYRISHHGKQWQVNELHGPPTAQLQQELDAATAQGIPYTPSAAVLAATKDLLPSLKPPAPAYRAATIAVRSRGHFVKQPMKDPRLEWAKLVMDFLSAGKNMQASGQTYYFKDITPDRLAGETTIGNIVTGHAGIPIPISLEGPFTMYRIE